MIVADYVKTSVIIISSHFRSGELSDYKSQQNNYLVGTFVEYHVRSRV